MHAHEIVEHGGPDALVWRDVADTAPGDRVVVDVRAAGVSFADLLQTRGEYQFTPPFPYSPGMDAAGIVRSAPLGSGFEPGQRVAMLVRYGCWRETVAVSPDDVLPVPDDLSLDAAAAFALDSITALFVLTVRGGAEPGETVLVHGAAGGVGIAAVQLGRALGVRTIAIVSDEPKRRFALEHGASDAILADGWLDSVRELIGDDGVDLVVDPVGGDRVTDSLRALGPGGRLLVVGFAGGEIPSVRLNRLLLGNSAVIGAACFEYFERRPHVKAQLWSELMRFRTNGALADPPLTRFAFDDARGALRAIGDRRALGKLVLSRGS